MADISAKHVAIAIAAEYPAGAGHGAGTARRAKLRSFLTRLALHPTAVALALLVLWQLGSGVLFNAYYLSRPTDVVHQIIAWADDGYLWRHFSATLFDTGIGFALAALSGTALALLLGSSPRLDRIFGPFTYVAYAMPKVVLAPLLILWVGVGSLPAILMSFLTAFFMVFFNVYSGVRSTSETLIRSVQLMGASPLQLALKVRLPAAMPFVALGLHQGLVYAFHGAIVGEMTSSNQGLGYVLIYAASDMDANGVIAALTVLGLVAFILLCGLNRLFGTHESAAGVP